jgi:hypothetical protein
MVTGFLLFQASLAALLPLISRPIIPAPALLIILRLIILLLVVIPGPIVAAVIPAMIPRSVVVAVVVVSPLPAVVPLAVIRLLVPLVKIVKDERERERDAKADLRLSRALGGNEQAACGE